MTRKINIALPSSEIQQANNWKILRDSIDQKEFDPFSGATPAARGFTNVGLYWAYYFVHGPIVYFSITLINDGGGSVRWGAGDYFDIPFQAATRGTNLLESHKCFPATERNHAGVVQDWFYLQSTTIVSAAGHSSGASDDTNVSGWYFRE